jgi:hypothetical protein
MPIRARSPIRNYSSAAGRVTADKVKTESPFMMTIRTIVMAITRRTIL